MKIRSMVA